MLIKASCSCGKTFQAKPKLAGKTVKCPACGQPLSIPLPSSAIDDPLDLGDLPLEASSGSGDAPGAAPTSPSGGAQIHPASFTGQHCTSCRAPLSEGAILCVACGVDQRTGQRMQTQQETKTGALSGINQNPDAFFHILAHDGILELYSFSMIERFVNILTGFRHGRIALRNHTKIAILTHEYETNSKIRPINSFRVRLAIAAFCIVVPTFVTGFLSFLDLGVAWAFVVALQASLTVAVLIAPLVSARVTMITLNNNWCKTHRMVWRKEICIPTDQIQKFEIGEGNKKLPAVDWMTMAIYLAALIAAWLGPTLLVGTLYFAICAFVCLVFGLVAVCSRAIRQRAQVSAKRGGVLVAAMRNGTQINVLNAPIPQGQEKDICQLSGFLCRILNAHLAAIERSRTDRRATTDMRGS